MNKYEPQKIEAKWQKIWDKNKNLYHGEDNSSKPKHYQLIEFPYPSGAGLHVGHCMGYGASDAYSRMKRMQGFNVMFPMGWDAFGLPTENFAIKTGRKPADVTKENTDTFRRQMKSMGYSFDWDREVNTSDPNYYKWTQWIFMQFYKHAVVDDKLIEVADDDTETPRLAYQAEIAINWCPSCKIGLANEEVISGKCERCETEVTKKMQKQWMLRITAYADRLIKDLETVDYLDKIKTQQVNWIGRSTGTNINFNIKSKKKTVLIIHGFTGHSKENWFPWLKDNLEKDKYKVLIPDLPNTKKPKIDEWLTSLKNLIPQIEGDLSVIGHSMGCIAACKFLEETGIKADRLILVAPSGPSETEWKGLRDVGFDDSDITVANMFNSTPLDLNKIKNLSSKRFIYFSDNDPYVPRTIENDYSGLEAIIRDFHDKGHFNHGHGVTSFPEILTDLFDSIEVYTTRADTLFGCTYIVIAPESGYMDQLKAKISNLSEVEKYIDESKKKSDMERTELQKDKTGVKLEGVAAINPINNEEVDIYVADYVLANYGTGAVMAVPAHDDRDYEFAKKYGIEIKQVILPISVDSINPPREDKQYTKRTIAQCIIRHPKDNTFLTVKWNKFPWHNFITGGIEEGEELIEGAIREIKEETGYKNIEFLRKMPVAINSHFYAAHKDVNRNIIVNILEFRLKDLEQGQHQRESYEDFDVVWVKEEELPNLKPLTELPFILRWLKEGDYAFTDYGVLINSKEFDGLTSEEAKKKITEKLKENNAGDFAINYKLRDWIFSRQHYWGEPIPIIHCGKCGMIPVDEKDLPVTLPDVENYQPTNTGESPLAAIIEWVNVKCPKCGGEAKRETDTMPNWAGSSWYFLAYCMQENTSRKSKVESRKERANLFIDNKEQLKYWQPVDLYNGGMEHTTLHLLYSRFWNKFLFDLGVAPTTEPYQKRIAHGIILGSDGRKMSKSFGNVINPDDVSKQYGADTTRAYIMFIGPYDTESAWNTAGVAGVSRFLNRVYNNFSKVKDGHTDSKELLIKINQSIKGITDDLENFRLNTVISKLMELNNTIEKSESISKIEYDKFILLLFPVAPHLASELWEMTGHSDLLDTVKWPEADNNYLIAEEIEVVVQINGKVRDKIMVAFDINDEELKSTAMASEKVKANLEGREIIKTIVVPKKLISIVVK